VAAELFHAGGQTDGRTDGRTDITMSIVIFRNFANVSKNVLLKNEQFVIPHRHNILQETEKLDRSSVDLYLSMFRFYENIRRNILLVFTTF
jgi:hypothetical protein